MAVTQMLASYGVMSKDHERFWTSPCEFCSSVFRAFILSPQSLESDVIKLSLSHKHRIEAFLGARRKITCDFHGSPPITVTWTKKGLDKLPSRVENHGASLLIKKVALSDAGQYICNASNAFSSGTSYVNVSVYGKKSVLNTFMISCYSWLVSVV